MDKCFGFIGLGTMGTAMATLLSRHVQSFGGVLYVFNRTNCKTKAFCATNKEIVPTESPSELATSCRYTFSCLANDDALVTVFHQYLENLPLNKMPEEKERRFFVDLSTVKPDTVRNLVMIGQEHGVMFIHCPVLGRREAAASGKLKAMISGGNASDRIDIKQLIEPSFAQNGIMDLGDDPGAAGTMNLVGNYFIVGQIELASECLALAAKAGLPATQTLNLMQYVSGGPIPGECARRIASGDVNQAHGLSVDLGLKNVSHIQDLGKELSVPLPIADLAGQHLLSAKAYHGGHVDWGAIGLAVRAAAGLDKQPYLEDDILKQ